METFSRGDKYNGRQTQWKMTSIEDDLNGRQHEWKMTQIDYSWK
jgi:hypothetical protein